MPAQTIETLAQEFFFEAMLADYASGAAAPNHPTLPGWKQFVYQNDPFILVDSWCNMGGGTQIFFKGQLVWDMKYGGSYSSEDGVIPLLRAALYESCSHSNFTGGRGPQDFTLDGLKKYINNWRGDFTEFTGHEVITDPHRECSESLFGEHTYSGGMQIPRGSITL